MNNSILLKMEKIFVVFALLSAACLSAYSQSKGFSRGIDLFNNSDRQVKYAISYRQYGNLSVNSFVLYPHERVYIYEIIPPEFVSSAAFDLSYRLIPDMELSKKSASVYRFELDDNVSVKESHSLLPQFITGDLVANNTFSKMFNLPFSEIEDIAIAPLDTTSDNYPISLGDIRARFREEMDKTGGPIKPDVVVAGKYSESGGIQFLWMTNKTVESDLTFSKDNFLIKMKLAMPDPLGDYIYQLEYTENNSLHAFSTRVPDLAYASIPRIIFCGKISDDTYLFLAFLNMKKDA